MTFQTSGPWSVMLCVTFNAKMTFEIIFDRFPKLQLWGLVPFAPYVPARFTRGFLVAHRHTFMPPRFRTSQNNGPFVPLSISLWNYSFIVSMFIRNCYTSTHKVVTSYYEIGVAKISLSNTFAASIIGIYSPPYYSKLTTEPRPRCGCVVSGHSENISKENLCVN